MNVKVTYNGDNSNTLELLYKLLVDIIVKNESTSEQAYQEENIKNEKDSSNC